MGMLRVVEFVSLDGVVQGFHGPDERDGFRHSGWGDGYQDESQVQSAADAVPSTGAYLVGRRTYEELAQFWPFQPDDNPMAAHLNRTPKHVVTHRTEKLAWPHARRLEGELVDGVTELKATTDGNVVVLGSGAVVAQLFAADLVDEILLFVHPLVLGSGRRLFPRADQLIRMRLEGVDRTPTGVVSLRYVRAR